MALGRVRGQARFEDPRELLGARLRGIYRFLAEHGERIFGVDYFAELYKKSSLGRPTVPARVLATVMILQAHEGLSDQSSLNARATCMAGLLLLPTAAFAGCGASVHSSIPSSPVAPPLAPTGDLSEHPTSFDDRPR
jgi:hypothetical protein